MAITGNGLKTVEVVQDNLEQPGSIPAKLDAFDKFLHDDQARKDARQKELSAKLKEPATAPFVAAGV